MTAGPVPALISAHAKLRPSLLHQRWKDGAVLPFFAFPGRPKGFPPCRGRGHSFDPTLLSRPLQRPGKQRASERAGKDPVKSLRWRLRRRSDSAQSCSPAGPEEATTQLSWEPLGAQLLGVDLWPPLMPLRSSSPASFRPKWTRGCRAADPALQEAFPR